ncbi:MAG: methionine synthase, partial [Planctomycetes bacterium]|nr:methionine synthase [Planctomycetota bacterium]
ITTEWYRFAQSLTKKPVKGMLTGPYTLMDWSFNEFYDSRRDAALALARQVRREVEALVQAGCRIIQIDEPAVSVRSEELPLAVEALGVCTAGIDAYFITHICYGTFEKIYPQLLDLPVHNLDLEMSNSQLDLLPLLAKNPPTKDVSFGLVDVHSHMLETPEVVLARLEEALAVVPPEGLWCDPDCGLKTRTTDEAQGKILAIVAAARMLRERKAGQ